MTYFISSCRGNRRRGAFKFFSSSFVAASCEYLKYYFTMQNRSFTKVFNTFWEGLS